MKQSIRSIPGRLWQFISRYLAETLASVAILLFCLSFITPGYDYLLGRQVSRVQANLHRRQQSVERYVLRAFDTPPDEMLKMPDLPEDIVIYRYLADTLQSWVHQFPIGNDALQAYSFTYRLQYQSNSNVYSAPLAYIGVREHYVNLGSDWYILNMQLNPSRNMKVVTGIRIKTEHPFADRPAQINRRLHLDPGFTTVDINYDDAGIVYGLEGAPLFSIVADSPEALSTWSTSIKWYALLFAVLSLFVMHSRRRAWSTFWIAFAGLVLIRLAAVFLSYHSIVAGQLFSPLLYADVAIFDSFGSFLLNHLLVALTVILLFMMRGRINQASQVSRRSRIAISVALCLGAALLVAYIHLTLHSLILNSTVVMEPFRIGDLSIYTLLCYLAYAALFLALLCLLQMASGVMGGRNSLRQPFSYRGILIYVLVISAYCVIAETAFGREREYEMNRVRTAKLAIERDLRLESDLRTIEASIAADPFFPMLSSVNAVEIIRSRLVDRYLTNEMLRKYDMSVTVCGPRNLLAPDPVSQPLNCYQFFSELIRDAGTVIAPGSSFYFIKNHDGRASYLGMFVYFSPSDGEVSRMFLELKARYKEDPFDIFAQVSDFSSTLPARYSYARYSDGMLVMNDGAYRYSTQIPQGYPNGYIRIEKNRFIHFINSMTDTEMTVISRSRTPFFTFVISFSYLFIFFAVFMLLMTARHRSGLMLSLPPHSLKRRITLMTTGIMALALASLAAATIFYTGNIRDERNQRQMQERISSLQTGLSEACRYATAFDDLRTPQFLSTLESLSRIMGCEIHVYDVHGQLLCSTKPELFDRFVVGKRMNADAFEEIVHLHALNYSALESLSGVRFYSLYAPLTNGSGEMVAIINTPFLSRSNYIEQTAMSSVAMIINIYLVLLIAAIILGLFLSNSMLRPLDQLRYRLQALGAGRENQHIRYRNPKDEIGVLVSAYNKMVDDLEESTRRLAASERERAWKEMARQIAHEIKNPLTPMRLSIQHLIRLKKSGAQDWQERIEPLAASLLEQIEVLSDTASEFSAIARTFQEDAGPVDVDALLREQVVLFEGRENIDISYSCTAGNTVLRLVRQQMTRVFVNLLTNSVQAIEGAGGRGRIRVLLCEETSAEGRRMLRITFEDDGPGVPEDNIVKLFTPNFTTKTGGSGLGLVISRSIIEQTGGTLSYSRSETLGGACFTVLLFA